MIKVIGATIYACEGTKQRVSTAGSKARRVELCNSDKRIMRSFLEYLRTFSIDERKLRARVFLHADNDEQESKEYWSQVTQIPIGRFIKTSWRKPSIRTKKRLPFGTCAVRYGDAHVFKKIVADIDMLFH